MSDVEQEILRKHQEQITSRRAQRAEMLKEWQRVLTEKPLQKIEWLEETDVTWIDETGEDY